MSAVLPIAHDERFTVGFRVTNKMWFFLGMSLQTSRQYSFMKSNAVLNT